MRPTPASGIGGRLRSVRFALAGIRDILATQHNARVHASATLLVVVAGWLLSVTPVEWCLLALAVAAVWAAEAFNTALETLCDAAAPGFHPLIGKSKDAAAGAVLLAAIGAAVVGAIVFVPKLVALAKATSGVSGWR